MPDVSVHRMRERGVLDQVEGGESFTVTRRGRPVARLVPLAQQQVVSWQWDSTGSLQAQGGDGQTYIVPHTCKGST